MYNTNWVSTAVIKQRDGEKTTPSRGERQQRCRERSRGGEVGGPVYASCSVCVLCVSVCVLCLCVLRERTKRCRDRGREERGWMSPGPDLMGKTESRAESTEQKSWRGGSCRNPGAEPGTGPERGCVVWGGSKGTTPQIMQVPGPAEFRSLGSQWRRLRTNRRTLRHQVDLDALSVKQP